MCTFVRLCVCVVVCDHVATPEPVVYCDPSPRHTVDHIVAHTHVGAYREGDACGTFDELPRVGNLVVLNGHRSGESEAVLKVSWRHS